MLHRLKTALPNWRVSVFGSVAWAALMAASASVGLWMDARTAGSATATIVIIFAIGGLSAFVPALTSANLFHATAPQPRLALAFVSLTFFTIGLTATIYALHFRYYFSQWHGDPFTVRWAYEFAFTFAAAGYQFAVLGLRLFFPVGFLALFAVSFWYANRSH